MVSVWSGQDLLVLPGCVGHTCLVHFHHCHQPAGPGPPSTPPAPPAPPAAPPAADASASRTATAAPPHGPTAGCRWAQSACGRWAGHQAGRLQPGALHHQLQALATRQGVQLVVVWWRRRRAPDLAAQPLAAAAAHAAAGARETPAAARVAAVAAVVAATVAAAPLPPSAADADGARDSAAALLQPSSHRCYPSPADPAPQHVPPLQQRWFWSRTRALSLVPEPPGALHAGLPALDPAGETTFGDQKGLGAERRAGPAPQAAAAAAAPRRHRPSAPAREQHARPCRRAPCRRQDRSSPASGARPAGRKRTPLELHTPFSSRWTRQGKWKAATGSFGASEWRGRVGGVQGACDDAHAVAGCRMGCRELQHPEAV